MSRGMKILWIVIGCAFALGVALVAVGFSLGASGSAWYDHHGLHWGTAENIELADDNTEAFKDIDVKLIEADVEIIPSNHYGYEFSYFGINEPTVQVRNGTLTVVEQDNNWRINIFNFNWTGWVIFNTGATLKVYVPSDASLNNVSLSTASGNTVFNGNQTKISSLNCNSASGNINLANLDLNLLALNVASGDVKISNVSAETADINILSGWLKYNGAKLKHLTLNMTSGNVNFEGEVTSTLQLRTLSGDVDITLAGNREDYSIEFRKLSGDIRVNGQRIDGNFDGPGSNVGQLTGSGGRIDIDTTSGNVNINFK